MTFFRRLPPLLALAIAFAPGCSGGSGDDPDGGGGGSSACAQDDVTCICFDEPRDITNPFEGTCDENAFGADPGICCRGPSACRCEPVRCGISGSTGNCLCGIGAILSSTTASCDGTASTCCTQDTGYCYCEEGCEGRFGNRLVSSCDAATDTAVCQFGDTRVPSCE